MRTKDWLINIRKKNTLTQEQLAKKIGLSPFTIMQIEQGKRMGSADTWDKIESFFENDEPIYQYESTDLINEIKEDIEEFGEDHPCVLIYKVVNNYILFTNYDFIVEEEPFNPEKELEDGENYIETSLQYALEVFEAQNKLI